MDFTPELLAFQGAIISADNVRSVSEINSKGGNEEKVNFIVSSLKRFLEEKYIDANGLIDNMMSTTRKFVLYLTLNSDLNVTHDLIDIMELEPIIWSAPILPKYLLCEIICQLHMEKIVYEIIPACWPQLGIEVAEAFLINLKYSSPIECLSKLMKLTAACYKLMCKLTCFLIEDDNDTVKCLSDVLQKYLMFYINVPNKHKLDTLSTDELYKYKGKRLKSVLFLVLECFNSYTTRVNFCDDDPIYRLTYNKEYIQVSMNKVCDSSNKAVLEFLNNTNISLLDIFQEIVMDISVEIFCAWSEFEEEGKSVQQTIGELCDKVHTKLLSISDFSKHPVVVMLELMARKPTDVKDIINTIDTTNILEKIFSNDEDSESWLHALVFKDNLWEDNALIDVIDSKINMFYDKECLELFNKIKRCNSDDSEREEFLICLRIKLFNKCNVIDKHKILKEHFKDKVLVDTVRPNYDFNRHLTEMFNKIIADANADLTGVLAAFYQVPAKVYEKIFGLATHNNLLINPMLKVMVLLKDYAEFYYNDHTESCAIKNMKYMLDCSLEITPSKNIIKFICELKSHYVISASQLLMLVIMPGIHDALVLKNIGRLHVHVKLLTTAYTKEELSAYKAPIIVTMAQILMTVRRVQLRLKAFEMEALITAETVIRFLKTFITTFSDQFSNNERSWIRRKLFALNLHPINFYYFKSFWNNSKVSLFECVTQQPIRSDVGLSLLSLKLSQILPWAILDEWYEVWDSFVEKKIRKNDVLRVFHTAISALTTLINTQRTENTLSSLFYCFKNFFYIIRYKYFEEPIADNEVKFCMSLLAENLELINAEDFKEIESVVLPLFSYLSEKKVDFKTNVILQTIVRARALRNHVVDIAPSILTYQRLPVIK